jgi:hypothetical protein
MRIGSGTRSTLGNPLWEPPTFIQAEIHLMGSGSTIRYPRKQIGKHILEVTQSTVRPSLLSSQRFGSHVSVTTNGFHGYAQACTSIRSRADKKKAFNPVLGDINTGTWPSRLGKSRIWDSKSWSWVPRGSDLRMTTLARTIRNCKRQTRPVVRKDVT